MTLRNIDIGLLRAFVAVAETGRMTQAARVIHVTQSAVSQKIRRLEDLLGITLFERRFEAAHLTPEGERFLNRARRLIALNDEIVGEMRGSDFSGEVKLGVPHDVVGAMLPAILRLFRQEHPNVLVTLVSDVTAVLRERLNERALDLALMTEREQPRHEDHLLTDPLVWAGAHDGDAARRRPLSVALGQENCGFRASAVDALDRAQIPWRPICQVGSLEPVFATLEADMAIAPFLARTVPERLAVIRDAGLPTLPSFHITLRVPSTGVSPATRELARHIRDGFAQRYR